MKHAGPAALDTIEPLLAELRSLGAFKEKGRGIFYRGAKAALHFHEDPAGLFADYRAAHASDFTRFRVNERSEQAELLRAIKSDHV